MSFFGFGSGTAKLSSVDDFLPKKKARKRNGKNGKRNGRNGNGNGSAKRAARGFESPGFFDGLQQPRNGGGIPKIDSDIGVGIPELGEGFNSRIGNIGTGFTESVNPFKIGFTDILTGNGRSGEIISSGAGGVTSSFGKRKRGRPKGSGKKQRGIASIGSGLVPKKPVTLTTKGAKKLKAEAILLTKAGDLTGAQAKLSQIKSKSVGGLLKQRAGAGLSGIRESIRERRTRGLGTAISFQADEFGGDELSGQQGPVAERAGGFGTRRSELELEGRIDDEQVGRFRQKIAAERESESSIDELVEEENGLDEDMEDIDEDDTIGDDFAGGEISR